MSDSEEEEISEIEQPKTYPAPPPLQPEDYYKRISGSGSDADPYIYTDEFGIAYTWNKERSVWESREDIDTLIKIQQEAYSAASSEEKETAEQKQTEVKEVDKEKEEKKKRKKEKKKKRDAEKRNTSVYISGLPSDTKDEEILNMFTKCGVPKKDPETAKPKFKIYRDEQGVCKGDGLFTYFKPESVDLALSLLDDGELRPGVRIRVQKATFENKAKDNSAATKKKSKTKKTKIYNQEKELGWEEDETKHIVIKNMFDYKEIDLEKDPTYYDDLLQDLESECLKFGPVEKIKIFERHPLGVAVIIFEDHNDASDCLQKMDGRYFGGRQLIAEYYDGWTDYKSQEVPISKEEEQRRIDSFGDWLEKDDD